MNLSMTTLIVLALVSCVSGLVCVTERQWTGVVISIVMMFFFGLVLYLRILGLALL